MDNSIWKPPVGKETPVLIQKPGLYSGGSPGGWDRCRGDMQIFVNVISDPCQAQADVLELVIQRCIQGGSKLLAVLLSSQIS